MESNKTEQQKGKKILKRIQFFKMMIYFREKEKDQGEGQKERQTSLRAESPTEGDPDL